MREMTVWNTENYTKMRDASASDNRKISDAVRFPKLSGSRCCVQWLVNVRGNSLRACIHRPFGIPICGNAKSSQKAEEEFLNARASASRLPFCGSCETSHVALYRIRRFLLGPEQRQLVS